MDEADVARGRAEAFEAAIERAKTEAYNMGKADGIGDTEAAFNTLRSEVRDLAEELVMLFKDDHHAPRRRACRRSCGCPAAAEEPDWVRPSRLVRPTRLRSFRAAPIGCALAFLGTRRPTRAVNGPVPSLTREEEP
jgi:hypothetical protein